MSDMRKNEAAIKHFLDLMDWEGGAYELYDVGVEDEDIPEELRDVWDAYTAAASSLDHAEAVLDAKVIEVLHA